MRVAVLFLFVVFLSGCGGGATVSKNQCIASDWETMGYRDGVNGYRNSRLLEHQDACVRHGIVPDRVGYMNGWEQGVREYCMPNNAFEIGERGDGHDNVCPADMQSEFTRVYREGRKLYFARSRVNSLRESIGSMEARIEQIKARIVSSAASQLDPTLDPIERIDRAAYTHRLTEEKRRIESDLPALMTELTRKETELESLRQALVSVVY